MMKSVREVTEKYNKLLQDVVTKEFYKVDLTNRVNCYTCQICGTITKTRDIDSGVTPFMIGCWKCKGTCYSSFYKDIAPFSEPSYVWYRPTLDETLKLRSRREGELEHVLQGGLLMKSAIV